jgi:hypothetical protein
MTQQKPEHSRVIPDIERYKEGASYCATPPSRVSGADAVAEMDKSSLAVAVIAHSVAAVLSECGNSYANRYTEEWLLAAKSLGAYHGRTVGKINDLREEWENWLDSSGGLPDLPNASHQGPASAGPAA